MLFLPNLQHPSVLHSYVFELQMYYISKSFVCQSGGESVLKGL